MYTDGLVERRGESIDDGFERLAESVGGLPDDVEPGALCDAVSAALLGDAPDDETALLGARLVPPADQLSIEVPAVPESLATVRHALSQWLEAGGAGAGDVGALTLACGEAAANAVEHAYGPEDRSFELRAVRDGDDVTLEIRDRGSWRKQRGEDRGRGLMLMEALLDDVEIDSRHDGTTVLLRKRLAGDEDR
jgi:anti-sigma regulatory factor (Ser/Thr protein kinase)